MTTHPKVSITVAVDWSHITNAITGFVEARYTAWCRFFYYQRNQPSTILADAARDGEHTIWYNDPSFWTGGGLAVVRFDKPDEGEGECTGLMIIGQGELRRGLELMAEKAPRHFADLLSENDDAETHDVFMQMVILGDIIYG